MMMTANLYSSLTPKGECGLNTSVYPTHYVHRLQDSLPTMHLLANTEKGSSLMNLLHAHVAKLQEPTFSITANDTGSHGTPNKTPSRTFSHFSTITQARSAFKKALHSFSCTFTILHSSASPTFFSPISLVLSHNLSSKL